LASDAKGAASLIAAQFNIRVECKPKRKRAGITLEQYAEYVGLPESFLTELFVAEDDGLVLIPYADESGATVSVQARRKLDKSGKKDERFFWRKGGAYLYGAWMLPSWRERKVERILVVEGATDVQVCAFNDIAAVGAPGASTFKPEWAPMLLPFPEIVIIKEPGKGGEAFVQKVCSALKGAQYPGAVKVVSLSEKDPRDLWLTLNDQQQFKAAVEQATITAVRVELYPAIPRTADLIFQIQGVLLRHVVFKDDRYALLIAIWVCATYLYDVFTNFGYLWLNSPVKRCGKSLLEEILQHLCANATPRLSNVSEAAIFRLADKSHTLILDEIENIRSEDKEKYQAIMTVLNAGFAAGAKVPRVEKREDGFEVVYLNAYCPKVLAGINRLADTIEDRSFRITMIRKSASETVLRFNVRKQREELEALSANLWVWSEAKRVDIEAVYDAIDEVPELKSCDDRFQDISEPLVSVAVVADAEIMNGVRRVWPDLKDVLLVLGGHRVQSEEGSAIAKVVEVIDSLLYGREELFIATSELLSKIQAVEELAWIKSAKSLGSFLSKFGLFAGRDSTRKRRGYLIRREWLDDIRNRYAPTSEASETSETFTRSELK
jgi:hypothetical protein